MKTKAAVSVIHSPLTIWAELLMKTSEMLVASVQVVGHRTGRLAAAGPVPNARDQREFALMLQEKVDAANESVQAMSLHAVSLNTRAWQDIWATGTVALSLASSGTLTKSIEGQAKLARTIARSAESAWHLSDATAQIAQRGLKPIHARATANAKRLSRT